MELTNVLDKAPTHPMPELLIILLEIFGEVLFELFGEMFISLGIESILAPFQKTQSAPLGRSIAGIILLSSASSILFYLAIPTQLLHRNRIPGLSLLLAPPLVGTALHWFGKWRIEQDASTTRLATFWGGALFALVFSALRLTMVRFL